MAEDNSMIEAEIWKTIVYPQWNFEQYEVSNLGHVRNRNTGKLLTVRENRGLVHLDDHTTDKRTLISITRLCLYTFVGPPPFAKPVAKHIDNNNNENRLTNLCWMSHSEASSNKALPNIERATLRRNDNGEMVAEIVKESPARTVLETEQDLTKIQSYRNTFHGRLQELLNSARGNAKARLLHGRIECAEMTLTLLDLVNIYNNQKGRCFYSNVPLSICSGENWLISLERLDPAGSYVLENVVLCALEFNSASQWSTSKVQNLLHLRNSIVNLPQLEVAIENAKQIRKTIKSFRRRKLTQELSGKKLIECTKCLKMKEFSEFTKDIGNPHGVAVICRLCKQLKESNYRNSLRGVCAVLLKATTEHMKMKNIDPALNTLTLLDIFSKILLQRGKCYYSGVPLVFEPNAEWRCSLERLDNSGTYTPENTVLVAWEFNTFCQWSKQKFEIALPYMQMKYMQQ